MPVLNRSSYLAPRFLQNGHAQTLYAFQFRQVDGVSYKRERIETPDTDFIDLDWSRTGSRRLAILVHGMEGSSQRTYMTGMARAFNRRGWDAVAKNFRTCSGELNRQRRTYHAGATDDLHTVVEHITRTYHYEELALIGFSLGGNVILKYVGEYESTLHETIQKAVVFSVPCDLKSSSAYMNRPANLIYRARFMNTLYWKIRAKHQDMPHSVPRPRVRQIRNFRQFDNHYTAPMNGFTDADDYYLTASSKYFLDRIRIPTLLVNAEDDPFLPDSCYPINEARANPNFYLETPGSGGHVAFVAFNEENEYWSEYRACEFVCT